MRYAPTPEDEVEDLAALLAHVKRAVPGTRKPADPAAVFYVQPLAGCQTLFLKW